MELRELKVLRLFVPGSLLLILIKLFFIDGFSRVFTISKKFLSDFEIGCYFYLIPIYILGGLYYTFNIRWLLWKPFNDKVVQNIYNKLLAPFNIDSSSIDKDKLKGIFYGFVDNDNSLKEKAKRIRLNGLIWTSCMDGTVISFFGCLIFFIKYYFVRNTYNKDCGLILLFVSIFCFCLIFVLTKIQISLSNEQLNYITKNKKSELDKKIKDMSNGQ